MNRYWRPILLSTLLLFGTLFPSFLIARPITVIGIGRLGLSIALTLEKAGYEVVGVDLSPEYVKKLNSKTLESPEPKIQEYLKMSKGFRATTSLKEGLAHSDVYMIALSTTTGTEDYRLDPLTNLLSEISRSKLNDKQIIICSTVMPGYMRDVAIPLFKDSKSIEISYNPPFIAQGEIISGYTNPDMVLIGEASKRSGDLIESIHRRVCTNTPYFARMSVSSAEIAKLALNSFITFKIAYANLIGDIANETHGADPIAILEAIGKDTRVGSKYLKPGFGYGGPCFPRDNRALSQYIKNRQLNPKLFLAIDEANEMHAEYMAGNLADQNLEEYIFEDVSYKSNSPVKIIEQSQKLNVAKKLAERKHRVVIVDDPNTIEEVKQKFGSIFRYQPKKES